MENKKQPQMKTWHAKHLAASTAAERIADKVAEAVGSWPFIIGQTLIVLVWLAINIVGYLQHWDPYPFILLNLLFALQTAYTGPVIMMAQNRQSERDRVQAQADYETNVQAKQEIEELQRILSRIETEKLDTILKLLEERKRTDIPAV